jgi:VIT1/CCC1 family predicted Fe2+/Mn2+ transporter
MREKALADLVRQLIFGVGHGLISILGLSIGVASATGSSKTVVIAGLVGMLTGLATLVTLQFLSAKTQKEIYDHMIEVEEREFVEQPEIEKLEMRDYYVNEGFSRDEADSFVNRLSANKDSWLKAHVTHILEFIPSKTGNPARESLTLGLSHLLGSILTLLPYLLLMNLSSAIYASVILASITLFVFGGLKTLITGGRWYVSAIEFLILGMVALLAGYVVGILAKGLG